MKIFAIIAEYNPLHSGHLHHIAKTKKSCDRLVLVMSGSFTQRGEFAISDKYLRAISAINAGADMVIELPAIYSISPADKFAYGAIKTLSTLPFECLSFGSECGNINELERLADILSNENRDFTVILKKELDKGNPLVKARAAAVSKLCSAELTPNNTLAIEYINSIRKICPSVDIMTIKREGNGYNSEEMTGQHLSATAIRKAIFNGDYDKIASYLPFSTSYNEQAPERFSNMIMYLLKTLSCEDLAKFYDVSEGLNNRIHKFSHLNSYDELINSVKTKRYTMARIKRILLYVLLGITKDNYKILDSAPPYVNVLAIREDRRDMLSLINTQEIYTKPSDYNRLSDYVKASIDLDNKAQRILSLINNDYPHNAMQVVRI